MRNHGGLKVEINHIGIPLGSEPSDPNCPDSSIGEGMDITIQGVNGHLGTPKLEDSESISSQQEKLGYSDMSIGRGMDISITGDGGNRQEWGEGEDPETEVEEHQQNTEPVPQPPPPPPKTKEPVYDPIDDVVVEDCCPAICYRTCPCCIGDPDSPFWQLWYRHRLQVSRLIENKYFEAVVLTLILLSSFVMTLEDIWFDTRPLLVDMLYYLDRILTVVFFLETLLKLFAMGCVMYFGNAWCWLDFIIVTVSLVNFGASLVGMGNIPIFKTMRTLRALRNESRRERPRGALPSIFNVLLVCLIFWLIFAIIGINTFMGKFYKCIDVETGEKFSHEIIPNKTVCLNETGAIWTNARVTFDNVFIAYLALFQVATFKGWTIIMDDAIDSVDKNNQPHRETSIHMYFYFVFFIVFGSFFTLNLLVGVIIDKFNEQKNKGGSSLDAFMTEDQKKYIAAMKKASTKKPLKALPRPNWKPQAIVFSIITNKKFDMIIMAFIGLNMLTMMCDHYDQSAGWTFALDNLNLSFIVIFTAEMLLKMFALRHHYFAEPWNLFDFVVVLLSLAGLFLSDLIEKYFVSPTLLRVVRVAKVGRVLRLIKGAKGIRTLLFSLLISVYSSFSSCLSLPSSGCHSLKTSKLDRDSMMYITSEQALDAITDDRDCNNPSSETGDAGNCGNYMAGVAFLIIYLILSFLIIVNMYIAVILENYSQATEDVQEGITDEDYDLFYEIWQEFDPDGTQYMPYKSLSEFLDVLESPLQIPKPNKFKIIHMDIPIVRFTGDDGTTKEQCVFCADILDALTQDFFARKGNPIEEPPQVDSIK
ncbi:Sodium channel protein, partial [Caligus rogercresseyi]